MFKGFRQFVLRGNVLDLAVGVVIGGAFGVVVTALVKDLIAPLVAAAVGEPDFSAITFTVNGSRVLIGDSVNATMSFVLVAAAVYIFVVVPMNATSNDSVVAAPARSDDQEMQRVPERGAYCGPALCVLHIGALVSTTGSFRIVSSGHVDRSPVAAS